MAKDTSPALRVTENKFLGNPALARNRLITSTPDLTHEEWGELGALTWELQANADRGKYLEIRINEVRAELASLEIEQSRLGDGWRSILAREKAIYERGYERLRANLREFNDEVRSAARVRRAAHRKRT